MEHTIEFDEYCRECNGTGLYVGMAERNGIAVVCNICDGKGIVHVKVEYDDDPKTRKPREGVRHVLQVNPGICVGGDHPELFGGMSFEDWKSGKPFPKGSEMRRYTCPAWWYQTADYDQKPDWDWCRDGWASMFSHCRRFGTKEDCWARFDAEHPSA